MTRNLHRWLGWIACALGLLLAAQLAQAGTPCGATTDSAAGSSHSAMQSPCAMPGHANDDCVAGAPRVHAGATAPVPPEVSPPVSVLDRRALIVQARLDQPFFGGPAPGIRLPLHIVFHRHLI